MTQGTAVKPKRKSPALSATIQTRHQIRILRESLDEALQRRRIADAVDLAKRLATTPRDHDGWTAYCIDGEKP
jgi:hypothetical protein